MSPKAKKTTEEKKSKAAPKAKAQEAAPEALTLQTLSPAPGSHHRRKIVGRGVGSGHGRHATRGMKGQRSRRGDTKMIGFEGGQMPLLRRIPKRGFTPPFPKTMAVVNLDVLNDAFQANAEITPELLLERGLVKKNLPVKVLGNGELKKALKISAHAFSKQAQEKIASAGGTAQVITPKA